MILKDKILGNAQSAQAKAGVRQEQDVAFYLRRAFKDDNKVFVFNDISFEHNDETAQIDHLILHPFGFILIESKSITGEVKINQQGEWTRSYNGQWRGMPSALKQVQLQMDLLREVLHQNKAEILGKIIFGKLQQTFGGRTWDLLCAISSNAIIDRDNAPDDIANKLLKSEFIADEVTKLINMPSNAFAKLKDSRVAFNEQELKSICYFLLSHCKQETSSNNPNSESKPNESDSGNNHIKVKAEQSSPESVIPENSVTTKLENTEPQQTDQQQNISSEAEISPESQGDTALPAIKAFQFACKKCGDHQHLTGQYGKYGYYAKCSVCEVNSSMKVPCPSCQSKKIKVTKKASTYTLNCHECETAHVLMA